MRPHHAHTEPLTREQAPDTRQGSGARATERLKKSRDSGGAGENIQMPEVYIKLKGYVQSYVCLRVLFLWFVPTPQFDFYICTYKFLHFLNFTMSVDVFLLINLLALFHRNTALPARLPSSGRAPRTSCVIPEPRLPKLHSCFPRSRPTTPMFLLVSILTETCPLVTNLTGTDPVSTR